MDDIIVAVLYLEQPSGPLTVPSGFTLLTSVTQSGVSPAYVLSLYWKRATSAEPASYTWSWTSSQWVSIGLASYSGAITSGDPFDTFSARQNLIGTDQPITPSATTTVPNVTLLAAFGNFSSTTYTAGSGMTGRIGWDDMALQDAVQAAAGATGTKTTTAAAPSWGAGIVAGLKGMPTGLGNNFTCTWASDAFTATQTLNGGTATVDLWGENSATPTYRASASAYANVVSLVGVSAQSASNTVGATLTPALPGGWQANDLAVVVTAGRASAAQVPSITGYTPRSTRYRATNTLEIDTFYRFLQTGDTNPSVVVPSNYGNGFTAQVAVWRYVDTTTPFDVADVTNDGAAADPFTPPSITTSTDLALVVSAVATADDNALALGTANGFTLDWGGTNYDTILGSDHAVGLSELIKSPAGLTTMNTWDETSGASDSWAAITFALRPTTKLTINKPAGTAQNDVLVASIAVRPQGVTISPPSGWTPIRSTPQASGTGHVLASYWLAAGASEPASYTFTITGGKHSFSGAIMAFSNVDTTSPIHLENGTTTASGTSHPTLSLTTTVGNTMIVTAHAMSSLGNTWTADASLAEGADSPNNGAFAGHMSIEASYGLQTSPAPTGTKTATGTGPANTGTTHIIALAPKANSCTVTATLKHVRPSTTIAFRASSQAAVGSGVLTLTVPVPTGTADGDVMIAAVAIRPDTASVATPGGWTPVATIPNAVATNSKLLLYRKTAAGEPASYAFTLGASPTGAAGGMVSFSGVDTVSPVDVNNGAATASAVTHTTPSSTTGVIDTMLLATFATATSAGFSEGTGMGEAIDIASEVMPNTAGIDVASYYKLQPAVATLTKTGTSDYQLDTGVAHLLSLRPSLVGTTTTLGSQTGTFSSSTPTLTQIVINPSSGVAFEAGDRLELDVTIPSSATCNARIHFDGASQQSKLTTATIVPEAVLGLLLLAPGLPIAIRRRWIRLPWLERKPT
jgi:hypothetical protein